MRKKTSPNIMQMRRVVRLNLQGQHLHRFTMCWVSNHYNASGDFLSCKTGLDADTVALALTEA
jgi:hypothetical protein